MKHEFDEKFSVCRLCGVTAMHVFENPRKTQCANEPRSVPEILALVRLKHAGIDVPHVKDR